MGGEAQPNPEPFTPERVCDLLVEAFRCCPTAPVHSAPPTTPEPVTAHAVSTAHAVGNPATQILRLAALYLPARSDERLYLLTWARARATGQSIRDLCRAFGWPRESFARKRKAASRMIAEGLNRDFHQMVIPEHRESDEALDHPTGMAPLS